IESAPQIQIKNHSYGVDVAFSDYNEKIRSVIKKTAENGVIHVWAAGNERYDEKQEDPKAKPKWSAEDANKYYLTALPEVITVAALGSDGKFASYSSYGANLFVTAPSNSFNAPDGTDCFGITTTDRTGANYGYNSYSADRNPNGEKTETYPYYNYTSTFGGTSSAAPLVSGIVALGKEANPLMTVRMAKYALVATSDVVDTTDNTRTSFNGWQTNGAGYKFNHNYGFGRINAGNFVAKIADVAYVTREVTTALSTVTVDAAIPDNNADGVKKVFNIDPALLTQPIEAIEVKLNFTHQKRGDLQAFLISPSGMKSRLFNDTTQLPAKFQDTGKGETEWIFLTNAFWGETNGANWSLTVADLAPDNIGVWKDYELFIHMGKMVTQQVGENILSGTIDAESLSITKDGVEYVIPNGSSFSVRDGLRLLKGKLTVNGTFNLDGFESTIDGTLAGSGLFQQTGSGITTLNGDGSSFSGVYELFGGQFNVGGNGKLGGTMQVNAGTILAGTGQIGALNNNGTVKPGNGSVGTLKLTQFGASPAANYTQGSGGALTVAVVTPTSNSLLQAQGSATLDGTLETLWQGSSIPHNKTVFGTILSAAEGVSGRFANLLGNKISPTLFFKPQYDRATEVYLLTERDYATSDLVSSLTGNQRAISQMLNPLVNSASGDLDTVLDKIDNLTTNAQVAAAFDQLSPIAGVAYTNMTSGVASFQTGNVSSRLGDLRMGVQGYSFQGLENLEFLAANSSRQPFLLASNSDDLQGMIPVEPDPHWGFFVRGNLVMGDQKDTAVQRGYDFKNGGLTLGTDYRFSERFVGGVLFGMNTAKSWINDAGSTVKLDGYTLGIYGTYFREAFYIDAQAGYGWNSFDNSRRIVFPGIDRTATAKPSGSQTTAYGGTGYDFQFGPCTIGPALTFQYLSMGVNGYTEAGADSLNLQVDRQTTESYQGSAGVKGAWNWTKDKLKIAPRVWAFYRHEFGNVNPATIASLAQGSSAFTIESVAPEQNFFNVGTGINVHWTDSVLAYLNYEAQLGQSSYTAQSITLGFRLQF
ncbi:MAG: autotransporter domain-containing protein, partial [Syntrophus sp. (in: bacteria)]